MRWGRHWPSSAGVNCEKAGGRQRDPRDVARREEVTQYSTTGILTQTVHWRPTRESECVNKGGGKPLTIKRRRHAFFES